jgi:hypothetical protein
MSHRVTTETKITDRETAITAFKKANVFFTENKGSFDIKCGRTNGVLDLATGKITGDSDHWNAKDFDGLKQAYAVEVYVNELRRQGASVQNTTVDTEGNIVIVYQTTA